MNSDASLVSGASARNQITDSRLDPLVVLVERRNANLQHAVTRLWTHSSCATRHSHRELPLLVL